MLVLTKTDTLFQRAVEEMKTVEKARIQKMQLSTAAQTDRDEAQAQVIALIDERVTWQKLKPLFIKAYADTFSEEELRAIVEFYHSSGGRALLEKMPVLTARSVRIGKEQLGDLRLELDTIVATQTSKHRKLPAEETAQPSTH